MDSKLLDAGVEHLLRDVKDSTVSNLSSEVSHMASGLRALKSRLSEVQEYLNLVLEGRLPVNHDIMYHLQVSTCSITDMPAPCRCKEIISAGYWHVFWRFQVTRLWCDASPSSTLLAAYQSCNLCCDDFCLDYPLQHTVGLAVHTNLA